MEYGRATDIKKYPFEGKKEEKKVATGKADDARDFGGGLTQKAKPKNTIIVTQQRQTGAGGDNSNSQYASLGLRACHDANIQIPLEVANLAKKWWIDSQSPDESGSKLDKNAVGTGGETAKIQGWDYKNANEAGAKGRITP